MVQATLDTRWVPKEILPADFAIIKVVPQTGTYKGKEFVYFLLILESGGQMYQYEAKYSDKNFLVNTISQETDEWVGKKIKIRIGDNGYKQIC